MSLVRLMQQNGKKISILLVWSLMLTLVPFWQSHNTIAAANGDVAVYVGQAKIGNRSETAENMSINFLNTVSGFSYNRNGDFSITSLGGGDIYLWRGDSIDLFINIGQNEQLRQLAASGHARVELGWSSLAWAEEGGFLGLFKDYQGTYAKMAVINNGVEVAKVEEEAWHGGVGARSTSAVITPNTIIHIHVAGVRDRTNAATGIRGMYIRFKDEVAPVMNAYSFNGNGLQRTNPNTGQQELYVKENEYIELTYKFSEAVRPNNIFPQISDPFLRHALFVNPDGTGLPAQGQTQYLINQTYTSSEASLRRYHSNISYRYTGVRYHHSGNLPLEPAIAGTTGDNLNLSLQTKFLEAGFVDAAGNAATIIFPGAADNSSLDHLRTKTVNPFDYDNGGFRVIVDAVRPKYSKTGNGIQPEILTGVTLNNNDTIDFTVQFTEEVVPWRDHHSAWSASEAYLLFNNGMKAYYVSGSGSDKWLFRAELTEEISLEAPLLKVIALTHNQKPTDTLVLQDYAGNLLLQPANYKGIHHDGDDSVLDSTIDWANLMIDNTPPNISFRFEADGATSDTYRVNGKVTIDADDPNIAVPLLDPSSPPGELLPSRGIYRPSNMTGSSAPSVGLVYYIWSRSPDDPFADKEDDYFAAIKRYSLTGKQPREDLYPEDYNDLNLAVVNNKTNMIAPPQEALLPENSGSWYMHAWAADMTWDSARELAQYSKMTEFVAANPQQYQEWKDSHNGSESDKTVYADSMALAAVGDYANLEIWSLEDFKQEDSNWSYGRTAFLLDNLAPQIDFADIAGNATQEVSISVSFTDAHSGMKSAWYQFVPYGSQPSDAAWQSLQLQLGAGTTTVTTLNNVNEDGEYALYVRAEDESGNGVVASLEQPIIVDSSATVQGWFQPEANPAYTRTHDVEFYLTGLIPAKTSYAVTSSIVRPIDEMAYTIVTGTTELLQTDEFALTVTSAVYEVPAYQPAVTEAVYEQAHLFGNLTGITGDEDIQYKFILPVNPSLNGTQYVHIRVEPGDGSRLYTYTKAYYFDNEPPQVSFSMTGVPYPQETHTVRVTVAPEPDRAVLAFSKYQWIRENDPVPDVDAAGWLQLPADGEVTVDNEALAAGETANYHLHVYAEDAAGNGQLFSTGSFLVSKSNAESPPAASESSLIYLYGDASDGYTGIIRLHLETGDKRGYEYSISPNGGVNWLQWQPYTNFVSVELPSNNPQMLNLQVKFRVWGGMAGEPQPLLIEELSEEEPLYALARLNTTKPVTSANGVHIQVSPPLGVRVTVAADNPPSGVVQSGTSFKVVENGYYAFDLAQLNNPDRKEKLYIVVNNVDDTPPQGIVEKLSTAPTNGNVSVKLRTNEPVRVINNDGRDVYTFTSNGSFTFHFADEAGNIGTATAVVDNIDTEPPQVKIVRSYQYGSNADDIFPTIEDEVGNIIASAGVVLTVEKADPLAKDFTVVSGQQSIIVNRNGIYTFTVSDIYGNTTQVSEQVSTIHESAPAPFLLQYDFVDNQGNPLPEDEIAIINGQQVARGRMRLTVEGETAPFNMVFQGTTPARDTQGQFTNRISDDEGNYRLTRIFEGEGAYVIALTDLLGNISKIPVQVQGLDNSPPEIILNQRTAGIVRNKEHFNAALDLGGYTVTDNVSAAADITVTVSGLDLTRLGQQTAVYTAIDQAGNQSVAYQEVYVIDDGGMLIFANDLLISSALGQSALFDTNQLVFEIRGYDKMEIKGTQQVNEWGTYEVLYQSGLYREGQLKTIASKLTYQDLLASQFTVTFPQAGWYTIIVRNQEREREYSTFFIGSVK